MKKLSKKIIAIILVITFLLTMIPFTVLSHAEGEPDSGEDWDVVVIREENEEKPIISFSKDSSDPSKFVKTEIEKENYEEKIQEYKDQMIGHNLACSLSQGDDSDNYFKGKDLFEIPDPSDDSKSIDKVKLILFQDFSDFQQLIFEKMDKFQSESEDPLMNLSLYQDVIYKDPNEEDSEETDEEDKTIFGIDFCDIFDMYRRGMGKIKENQPLSFDHKADCDWLIRSAPPKWDLAISDPDSSENKDKIKKSLNKFLEEGAENWPYSIKAKENQNPSSLISLSNGTSLSLYNLVLDGQDRYPLIRVENSKDEDKEINKLSIEGNLKIRNGLEKNTEKATGGIYMGKGIDNSTKANILNMEKSSDRLKETLDQIILADENGIDPNEIDLKKEDIEKVKSEDFNNLFEKNKGVDGGALYISENVKADIASTSFKNNEAEVWGGAIYKAPFDLVSPKYDGLKTDEETKFIDNSAEPRLYVPMKTPDNIKYDPESRLEEAANKSFDGIELKREDYTPLNNYDINYAYPLVIYGPNGAEGDDVRDRLDPSKDLTLRKNPFEREGYNFHGWNTKKNGKGKNFDAGSKLTKAQIKELMADDKVITLYANWKKEDEDIIKLKEEFPPIKKIISGDLPEETEDFHFVLKKENSDSPMPGGKDEKELELTIRGEGEKSFDPITFEIDQGTEEESFNYIVREKEASFSDYSYDQSEYEILFKIKETGDQEYEVKKKIFKDGKKYDKDTLEFSNKYKKPEEAEEKEELVKTIIKVQPVEISQENSNPETGDSFLSLRFIRSLKGINNIANKYL